MKNFSHGNFKFNCKITQTKISKNETMRQEFDIAIELNRHFGEIGKHCSQRY